MNSRQYFCILILFNLDDMELTRKPMNIKFKIDNAQQIKIRNSVNAFIYDKVTKRQPEELCN